MRTNGHDETDTCNFPTLRWKRVRNLNITNSGKKEDPGESEEPKVTKTEL
jgi:hypothetical protein